MTGLYDKDRDRITYAFGHLVSSYTPDAHSGDSGELALDTLAEIGLDEDMCMVIEMIAEHVNGNYQYTGEADEFSRRAEAGEV